MFRIYTCLTQDHNLWLVLVAGFVCFFGCYTACHLLDRSKSTRGRIQAVWLATAAVATGCAIWSTHFIAMLAFNPGMPIGLNIPITLASIVVAISLTGIGSIVFTLNSRWVASGIGGTIIGLGIAAMHFTGMAAMRVQGGLRYDLDLVAVSIVGAIAFSVGALHLLSRNRGHGHKLAAASSLAVGICVLHFTAMGALRIVADPTMPIPETAFMDGWLAVAVAVTTLTLLSLALVVALFNRHLDYRSAEEADRLQTLADATTEGLVLTRSGAIIDANKVFQRMAQLPLESLLNRPVTDFLDEVICRRARANLAAGEHMALETQITAGGTALAVSVSMRVMRLRGKEHEVYILKDMSEQQRAEAQIQFLAQHDPLTELPNRQVFHERLQVEISRTRRTGKSLAVLCLDLDRFKAINDVYGHASGDALLKIAAERMQSIIRDTDTVARLSSDEFALIQVGVDQPRSAQSLAVRLINTLAMPFELDGKLMTIGASAGIAFCPQDGMSGETLLRNAATALSRAKSEDLGSYRFFEADMDERLREKRELEFDLRKALDNDEVHLVYQPQARVADREVFGFEALMRWDHPVLGAISPKVFIPLAEDSGFITTLGNWVLRNACREAARWPRPLGIAVNLSPVQFRQGDIVETVRGILEETNLDPGRLELEITEGVLMHDRARAMTTLKALKSLGLRIAMDDFGTGFSSLSYLQAFPFDKIKIDRSFVAGLENGQEAQAIIRAILSLGQALGLPVLAEGVEREAQLTLLQQEKCDEMQGYLISRPDRISAFLTLTHGTDAGSLVNLNDYRSA